MSSDARQSSKALGNKNVSSIILWRSERRRVTKALITADKSCIRVPFGDIMLGREAWLMHLDASILRLQHMKTWEDLSLLDPESVLL